MRVLNIVKDIISYFFIKDSFSQSYFSGKLILAGFAWRLGVKDHHLLGQVGFGSSFVIVG